MYTAIKTQQILAPLGSSRASITSPNPGSSTVLRNRSLRANQPDRLTTLKRGSIRGLQSIMGAPGQSPYSSNSSVDGRVSPSPSFATSTHEVDHHTKLRLTALTFGFRSTTPPCKVQVHLSSLQPLDSLQTYRIQLSERLKKTIPIVYTVKTLPIPLSASLTRSWLSWVRHGQKKACYVESNTGNAQGSGPRISVGKMCLW
jgi:hypothetical protein